MRFDDIAIDMPIVVGSHRFTREEILDFARRYDPQPFHLSDEGAASSHFGRLCASGWHTCAAWMRLTVDFVAQGGSAAGISPGIEEIRWTKPVYADDTVTYSNKVTSKRRLASRPGWAVIHQENTGINQHGDLVYVMRGPVLVPIED